MPGGRKDRAARDDRSERKDGGAALVAVVVLGLVMTMLIATGLTVATSGLQQALSVQRSTSALDAAYAGVQDYLARVNLDETYVRYGNPDSAFSATSDVRAPDPWNPAFGVGELTGDAARDATRTWAVLPGSGDTAKYRYEVDTSAYQTSGSVRLRVTGLSGQRTRTILASLRVKGFIDFAYFTDYEIGDPKLTGSPASCTKYKWNGRSNSCVDYERTFSKNDLIYGDIHSNDTMIICGATMTGVVNTASTHANLFIKPSGCANSSINARRVPTLDMPSTNTAMKQDAACLYTGPTRITYNADGSMTVVSPWTRYTSVSGAATNPAKCGSPSDLRSATGARVDQLDQDLLYVQNVQVSDSADPNYWAPTEKPAGLSCIGADDAVTTSATGIGWTVGSGASAIRYPLANEKPATGWENTANPMAWNTSTPAYGCRNGDLYVSGRVTTLTTAASENYVYVVDNLRYGDETTDIFGLVGQSAVLVWNPTNKTNDQPMLGSFNLRIDAAIISVDRTFQVQNYDRGGTRGALEVFGSIAQRFRGATSTFDTDTNEPVTGYTKAYQYDTLLKTVSPPKFLSPSATSFNVTRYSSVPVAFTASGAAR